MSDWVIRLYDLPDIDTHGRVQAQGITVRRALPPERGIVLAWIEEQFGLGWRSEAAVAFGHQPVTIWIALRDNRVLGFACHDATMKGLFGPTGVSATERGRGIGEALLFATLRGMREAGYAYGIIGGAGPVAFYRKKLEAFEIPGSEPGIYRDMLRPEGA